MVATTKTNQPEKRMPGRRPRLTRVDDRQCLDATAMTAYVQGALVLDVLYRVHTTLAEFLAAASRGNEKLRFRWEEQGRALGGMPAHAIRCLGPKVSRVFLGAALPDAAPPEVSEWIKNYDVDTQYVLRSREPLSQSLKLSFDDRQHLLLVDSAPSAYDVVPPAKAFDVMLVNPGSGEARRKILRRLQAVRSMQRAHGRIGVIARGDWRAADLRLLRGTGVHLFLNKVEMNQIAEAWGGADHRPGSNLKRLGKMVGDPALVTVTFGADGSVSWANQSPLVHVAAPKVAAICLVGAGDSFAATTCLSAAAGAPLGRACLLGHLDAARVVSGRPPAGSLRELDDEVK